MEFLLPSLQGGRELLDPEWGRILFYYMTYESFLKRI
jgi:hypothetical protein